ncbi:methylated-DNA--[protein]-cysteine S-methyltransferase [Spiroplasma endosymbiont of Polydrusus pterygomalis]|uniref:methylated-DNA--[protein]-cysteine S-methyltransferase n=1 Tax=Spiroplasma endosymbiont of Polydrusus pterygomalis TaxID=3139327 RepID=UPI003CCA8DFD
MKKYGYLTTKIGLIEIAVVVGQVVKISFVNSRQFVEDSSDMVIANCQQQLTMYFDRTLTEFNLPLALKGTPFQELVWSKTCSIKAGSTVTYQELARKIGYPKASRAVGTALAKNPLAIIVPCHRVVNKNKNIVNYLYGADIKKFLLAQESK